MSEKIPEILTLTAFAPTEEADGRLVSRNLGGKIAEYDPYKTAMWDEFLVAETGSIDEEAAGRKLAEYYLLKTSHALQFTGRSALLWTAEFNRHSTELYELPLPEKVSQYAADELKVLPDDGSPESQLVRGLYAKLAASAGEAQTAEKVVLTKEQKEALQQEIQSIYPEIYDVIGTLEDGPYESAQVREIFSTIVKRLGERNPKWNEWVITNDPSKSMLSVIPPNKEIDVPDRRKAVKNKSELLGLALHEIGVHAGRSVNGRDDLLSVRGLPGNTDAEEGLGCFFEYVTTDVIPVKNIDRYIDIALASGAAQGIELNRQELMEFCAARARLRQEEDADVKTHVNRIFRGGTGLPLPESDGFAQAVFTKDAAYQRGFELINDYVLQELNAGESPSDILNFLLSGKFDPTNLRHLAYLLA